MSETSAALLSRGQRTVVFFETDCEAIEALRTDALREFTTISVNDVVRAALRLAKDLTAAPAVRREFIKHLEAARAEDRRRRPE